MKSYTKKQLADLYGVSRTTFYRWLCRAPETKVFARERILTPKQVQVIFEVLGTPLL